MKTIANTAVRAKLGKRIRQLRRAQNITQTQLGFEAGLSRVEVSYLENGHKNVTLDSLHAIAGALGVHMKDLFEFEY